MNLFKLRPLALACMLIPLAGFASVAHAQEEESALTWNMALTSDYVFRGVSQTEEDPALQIGADYAFGPGFYIGIWASNVDFGSEVGADYELDTYIGWATDINDAMSLDVVLNRYNYYDPNPGVDLDYNELIGNLTTGPVTFKLGYTNDVYASNTDSFYYAAAASFAPGGDFGLDFGAGRTTFEAETELEDYTDFFISVSHPLGPLGVAFGYYNTDSNGESNFGQDLAGERFVLTFSIEG